MARTRARNYQHILKYTGVFGSVEVLKILIGLVRNKLVAMILGPDGMGLMSLFNSTIKLISDTTNLGIPISSVREISDATRDNDSQRLEKTVQTVRMLSIAVAVVGMIFCASLCSLLNKWTFTWGDHTLHFVLLSPVVGIMAILAGEVAILKGMRQLRQLAQLSIYNITVALLLSVPLFYLWGEAAIVPVLILTELVQLLLVMRCSYRLVPFSIGKWAQLPKAGKSIATLGFAFVFSGIFTSGADFLIRTYLNNVASLEVVGVFNAGFVIVFVYAGMVFSAMETDFFPRISAIGSCGRELNMTVSEQIEVSILIAAPMLVFLMVCMPIILPLLYSNSFTPAVEMVQIGLLSLLFRAVYLPIEYISLARAKSLVFMAQEFVGTALLLTGVIGGYHWANLWGVGLGLTCAYALEMLFVMVNSRLVFNYVISLKAVHYLLLQLLMGMAAYAVVVFAPSTLFYWFGGTVICLLSAGYSLNIIRKKTTIINMLRKKFQ